MERAKIPSTMKEDDTCVYEQVYPTEFIWSNINSKMASNFSMNEMMMLKVVVHVWTDVERHQKSKNPLECICEKG